MCCTISESFDCINGLEGLGGVLLSMPRGNVQSMIKRGLVDRKSC